MNITKYNFQKNRAKILECLKNSHLISFDFEMTGINANNSLRNANTDTVGPKILTSFNLDTGKQSKTWRISSPYRWESVALGLAQTSRSMSLGLIFVVTL